MICPSHFPRQTWVGKTRGGALDNAELLAHLLSPPTRIKSYLLTTFWSPNQYYYRPNIETPRWLCHRRCLLARLVTTDNGPRTPVVTSSSPTWSQSRLCFIVSVFYVPSTAISSNCSGSQSCCSDYSTPWSVLCCLGACVRVTVTMLEGFEAVVRPPVSPRAHDSGDQAPVAPRCQIRPGQGQQARLANLERVEILQMCGLWQLSRQPSLARRALRGWAKYGGCWNLWSYYNSLQQHRQSVRQHQPSFLSDIVSSEASDHHCHPHPHHLSEAVTMCYAGEGMMSSKLKGPVRDYLFPVIFHVIHAKFNILKSSTRVKS